MTGFIFPLLGIAAPTLAMILVAVFSCQDWWRERRRTVALRQWMRAQE